MIHSQETLLLACESGCENKRVNSRATFFCSTVKLKEINRGITARSPLVNIRRELKFNEFFAYLDKAVKFCILEHCAHKVNDETKEANKKKWFARSNLFKNGLLSALLIGRARLQRYQNSYYSTRGTLRFPQGPTTAWFGGSTKSQEAHGVAAASRAVDGAQAGNTLSCPGHDPMSFNSLIDTVMVTEI